MADPVAVDFPVAGFLAAAGFPVVDDPAVEDFPVVPEPVKDSRTRSLGLVAM